MSRIILQMIVDPAADLMKIFVRATLINGVLD